MIIWRHLLPWRQASKTEEALYWSSWLLWWDHSQEPMQ